MERLGRFGALVKLEVGWLTAWFVDWLVFWWVWLVWLVCRIIEIVDLTHLARSTLEEVGGLASAFVLVARIFLITGPNHIQW